MKKRHKIKQQDRTDPSYALATTHQKLTSQCGFLVFIKVLKALRLKQLAAALFPKSESNRGYCNGDILTTLIMMLNEGARCLSDVRHLHIESELLKREGIDKLPGVDTLSRWLHRYGKTGIPLINQLNQTVIAITLKFRRVKEVTLDIDATTIITDKVSATWTYMKRKGFTMMVGTLAEVGQVIAAELRDGKVSPKTDNVGFIESCRKLLPSGTTLTRVRSDAAGYQHQVIDYLMHHGLEFLIRAAMNEAIAKQIAALPEQAWQPLQLKDGQLSQYEWVARCPHMMYRSNLVFFLIVQRTCKKQAAKLKKTTQSRDRKKVVELYTDGTYEYRAIATNIKELTDSEIVHEYNQRGEHSENRIKELKSDFAAGRPPCSDFAANALYVCVCALAYNVFALMRCGLPVGLRRCRAPRLRQRVFGLAAKIVRQGRQWQLKLQHAHRNLLARVFRNLLDTIGPVLPDLKIPLLS